MVKKPTVNQGAKRIQLDLTSQEQGNSKSRNQSQQCGSTTQRGNSKIGKGLRNLGITQNKVEVPKDTRIQKEVNEEQPRAPTSNQVHPVRSEQLVARRADEYSPLPFGKSPRPEQASPRLDNLRFHKADQIQGHNFNRTTLQQFAQKNQGINVFKSPRGHEKEAGIIDAMKENINIKDNERKVKASQRGSRRVAVDLERSKSREVVVDSRHVKSRTQLAQRTLQAQRATAATPVQRTALPPKPLTATE